MSFACAGAALVFLTAPVVSQTQLSAVEIRGNPTALVLEIRQPTPLPQVLRALCREARAACELKLKGSAITVSPMTLRGHWNEVIATLLQGSNLEFASRWPSAASEARLIAGVPGRMTDSILAMRRQIPSEAQQIPATEAQQIAAAEAQASTAPESPLDDAATSELPAGCSVEDSSDASAGSRCSPSGTAPTTATTEAPAPGPTPVSSPGLPPGCLPEELTAASSTNRCVQEPSKQRQTIPKEGGE